MKKYVEATWQEVADREHYYLINSFQQSATQIIQCNGEDVGRITIRKLANRVIIDGIHILESFQGQGIGRSVISQVIEAANGDDMPVELVLLKVNPAKKLYDDLGFRLDKEDMYRYYMSTAGSQKRVCLGE